MMSPEALSRQDIADGLFGHSATPERPLAHHYLCQCPACTTQPEATAATALRSHGSHQFDVNQGSPEVLRSRAELNQDDPETWSNLASVTPRHSNARVGGAQYSQNQLYEKALELDATERRTWNNLGTVGGGAVNGVFHSQSECYEKALELDVKYVGAWNNLGAVGGGTVSGAQYSETQCYENALQIDVRYTSAWKNLGTVGGGVVRGVQYSIEDCVAQSDPYRL